MKAILGAMVALVCAGIGGCAAITGGLLSGWGSEVAPVVAQAFAARGVALTVARAVDDEAAILGGRYRLALPFPLTEDELVPLAACPRMAATNQHCALPGPPAPGARVTPVVVEPASEQTLASAMQRDQFDAFTSALDRFNSDIPGRGVRINATRARSLINDLLVAHKRAGTHGQMVKS